MLINYPFDCYSEGVIHVIRCSNNHESSPRKYEQGGRKMAAEHLYAHIISLDMKVYLKLEL